MIPNGITGIKPFYGFQRKSLFEMNLIKKKDIQKKKAKIINGNCFGYVQLNADIQTVRN